MVRLESNSFLIFDEKDTLRFYYSMLAMAMYSYNKNNKVFYFCSDSIFCDLPIIDNV